MSDNKNHIEVKVITGEKIFVSKSNVVGFCHFHEHRGSITKSLLKSHECVKKECRYFEKYNVTYWNAMEQMQAANLRKKITARRIQSEKEAKQKQLLKTAQELIDELCIEIRVMDIKKIPQKKHFVVFYISKEAYNDCYKYLNFAHALGNIIGGHIELKHIKDVNGYYAVF